MVLLLYICPCVTQVHTVCDEKAWCWFLIMFMEHFKDEVCHKGDKLSYRYKWISNYTTTLVPNPAIRTLSFTELKHYCSA